ncbi:hypothetical protein ACFXTN_017227 [Malus domestica]
MLATMKSDKVDSATKVAPKPILLAAKIDSLAEKKETARMGSYEKSIMPASGEAVEICVFLKPDLHEDIDACVTFVDDVKWVVCPSSFAKQTTKCKKIALLAIMQKMTILATESMLLDQEDTKAVEDVGKAIVAEAYFSAEKIKRLESELVTLNGFNISALTSLQLETTIQEILN